MIDKNIFKNRGSFFFFVTPALVFYFVFMVIPMIGAGYYSLTNWNGINAGHKFIGIANYIEALTEDTDFRDTILFTFKYAFVMLIAQNCIAMFLALLIETLRKTKTVFRTILFLPNMISLIVGSYMVRFIFLKVFPDIGRNFTVLSVLDQSWTGDPKYGFWAIVAVSLWSGVGYMMLIYMAALQSVPKELREQALIDGANPLQVFLNVTLPMIMPAVTICTFLTLNNALKVFDQVFGLTGGGPGRTTRVMAMDIYYEAFSSNLRLGYGTAKAMILFVMILVITLTQTYIMKKREVEL